MMEFSGAADFFSHMFLPQLAMRSIPADFERVRLPAGMGTEAAFHDDIDPNTVGDSLATHVRSKGRKSQE
jgi:hypothetical protein